MNLLGTAEFKVGIMVIAVLAIIGVMSMKVSENPEILHKNKEAWFLLKDASGLIKNSSIKMAGVTVGTIKDIRLQDGMARIDIKVSGEIPLTNSTSAELRANGILGDKYIEIVPGNPQDPPLPEGGQITRTVDHGSMNVVMNEISKVASAFSNIAEKLKTATDDKPDQNQPIGRIIKNIEDLTRDLAEITGHNKGKINEMIDRANRIAGTLDNLVNDNSEEGFKQTWKRVMKSLNRLDVVMKNAEEVSDKINSGKGTIGRLINDDATVEKIETAVEKVSSVFDTASTIETSFDFHSEFMTRSSEAKSFIGVKIQPGLDRYYEIGIIDDPAGLTLHTDTTRTTGGTTTTINQADTYRERVKFTALFAKNIYDFTVKGGLIESRGGVGFDYNFWRNKFRFSVEAFDFADIYVRAYLKYNIYRGVYLVGGGDNIFDKAGYSTFVGAGLFLTNDDLKLILTKASF
jgi:phospholipid/cholesterol/gamma-HCH transport system substrate-binding protein